MEKQPPLLHTSPAPQVSTRVEPVPSALQTRTSSAGSGPQNVVFGPHWVSTHDDPAAGSQTWPAGQAIGFSKAPTTQ